VVKDRAAIEQNMAEDFRQIDGAGNVESKTSFVDGLLSPGLQIDPQGQWKIVSVQISRIPN
jgi:hypothetical protein